MDAEASTRAPHAASIEGARLYHSIKARLFETEAPVVQIGPHRLIRRLGSGGMGEVFLAHDDQLDRPLAVKLVHAKLSHDDRFAERMRREGRALAKLTHPNVVHVYEVGEHEGRLFLAMEYIEGGTLGAWIRERSPDWKQVLEAYLRAGEGLVAAHAAGLTHRDFKPDNVLRGDDGRICVADFGLARVSANPSDPALQRSLEISVESGEAPATLDDRLSVSGAVMGTPIYMPLEQLRGEPVDARSDQFSFCVALYEGLWGARPHVANNLRARELALVEDRPAVPRRGVAPSWVWPIVRRGLARDPAQRWPDMRSLLDQLQRAPLRRRARRRAVVAVTVALGGAWIGAGGLSERAPELCTIDDAHLAGVWDEASRLALRRALEGSPSSARVVNSLDVWTSSWLAEQAASCQATRIEGTQSEQMLDRRTVCFARQLGQVRALVEVLSAADAQVVARAGQALAELPDLGACSIAALDVGSEPVVDAAHRAELEAGYESLARARVDLDVGRPDHATALARTAKTAGEALGHAPLALEAKALLARITIERGQLAEGLEQLRAVVLAAERAELFELDASLRVQLARAAAGDAADPRLERWIIDEAQVALDRVDRPLDPREVYLQSARARIAEQAGDYAAAITAHARAHALAEGRLDAGQRALLRVGIGTTLYRQGDHEAARDELEGCLGAVTAAWGQGAPEAARIEFNLGMIATDLGEFDLAKQRLRSAITIDEATWGRESIEVARDRFALAYLAFGLGEIEQGCATIEELLPIYETKLGLIHDETASALNAAAVCRYHAADYEGAIVGFQRSLEIQRQVLGESHQEIGSLHTNIGEAQLALGQLDAAMISYQRALELLSAALPEDHFELVGPLRGQGLVWLEMGDAALAIEAFERALELVDGSQDTDAAELRFGLARALVAVNGDPRRANELASLALEGFEATGLEREAEAARAWLAEHSR
ncbi:serine/threonine protein kinase [Enhygromyxa salina]|uniref:Serine/threonine protein kinase n=2 Tax=Enhygromyxa salina TaxID=215803 RepID=A0A0C1ZYP7_9BACT|nr:serine/threonine protein kinase [Enhygromyxa salina]